MFYDLCELPVTFYHKNKISSSLSKVPDLKKTSPRKEGLSTREHNSSYVGY